AAGPGGRAPKRRRASENMRHLSGDRSWLRGSSDRPRSAGRYHKAARRRATILLPRGAARSLGDAAGGRAIDDKDEGSRPRADQLGGIGIGTRLVLEDDAHDLSLLRSAHQEEHARRVVEHRDRQRDAVAPERIDPGRDGETPGLAQRLAAGEERGGVAVLPEAEQDEVEARPGAGAGPEMGPQVGLVLLRRPARLG